ncbi:amidohydrolase [Embleya sp. NPDC056575]|uniref:amidohydrolase n=1 Tax=unclassified Embleya TaxID=2699296 RepID=UPI0036A85A0A
MRNRESWNARRPAAPAGDAPADLVLTGGRVHVFDEGDHLAQAIAVRAGRIVRVGHDHEVAPLIGPGTREIPLRGRAVLPGINDSHLHGVWLGAMWPHLLMDALTAGAADAAPPAAPALRTSADRRAAILRTRDLLAALGVTSYTEPGLGPGEDDGDTGCFGSAALADYAQLAAEGELAARVTALLLFGELDGPGSADAFTVGLREFAAPAEVPGWFRVAGVKIFADGIPPMRSAWVCEPYPDGTHGALLIDGDSAAQRLRRLTGMIRAAHAAGHQIGVHSTGDRTSAAVVSALGAAQADDPRPARHYLIHGDLLPPATLAEMAAAGIGLNTQPGIAVATRPLLHDTLAAHTLARMCPTRDALDAGVDVCLSSDSPVLTPDWRRGVVAAVTRAGVDGSVCGVDQRLAVREALRAYTVTPARQDGAESWKGSLEPGKVADLCVLAADPLRVEVEALPQVPVELTVVDGRVVYEATGRG